MQLDLHVEKNSVEIGLKAGIPNPYASTLPASPNTSSLLNLESESWIPQEVDESFGAINTSSTCSSEPVVSFEAYNRPRVAPNREQGPGTRVLSTADYLSLFRSRPSNVPDPTLSLQQILSQIPLLPSNPTMAQLRGPEFESYGHTHLDQMVNCAYFKPVRNQKQHLFAMVISRLRSSRLRVWIMLLSAKILRSLIDGDMSQNELHDRWAGEIEAAVGVFLTRNPTSIIAHDLRGDWLEVSLLRITLLHCSNAYQVLQRVTPMFLQAVYSCPELWSSDSDLTSIPLLNKIAANHYQDRKSVV